MSRPLRHNSLPHRRLVAIGALAWVILVASSCQKAARERNEIFRAAGNGDLAKAQILLDRNPNLISSKNSQGFTALHYAASYGYKEIAELLIARKSDVNAKTGTGDTPLHYAAAYGFKDIAELLLSNGADINARDNMGRTPLYDAAGSGRLEEVKLLLGAKAGIDIHTSRGFGALSAAASYGHEEVAPIASRQRRQRQRSRSRQWYASVLGSREGLQKH